MAACVNALQRVATCCNGCSHAFASIYAKNGLRAFYASCGPAPTSPAPLPAAHCTKRESSAAAVACGARALSGNAAGDGGRDVSAKRAPTVQAVVFGTALKGKLRG